MSQKEQNGTLLSWVLVLLLAAILGVVAFSLEGPAMYIVLVLGLVAIAIVGFKGKK